MKRRRVGSARQAEGLLSGETFRPGYSQVKCRSLSATACSLSRKACCRAERQTDVRQDCLKLNGDRCGDLMPASGRRGGKCRAVYSVILALSVRLRRRGAAALTRGHRIASRGLFDRILQADVRIQKNGRGYTADNEGQERRHDKGEFDRGGAFGAGGKFAHVSTDHPLLQSHPAHRGERRHAPEPNHGEGGEQGRV